MHPCFFIFSNLSVQTDEKGTVHRKHRIAAKLIQPYHYVIRRFQLVPCLFAFAICAECVKRQKAVHRFEFLSIIRFVHIDFLLIGFDYIIGSVHNVYKNVGLPLYEAVKMARDYGNDYVILDTAGRLHIDEELMKELQDIKEITEPSEILLTIDAMLGQDAVNVSKTFNDMLDISGVILTKLDGDTRGGAALSVRYVTGKPIKFIGTGEKLDALEPFHPDRMASRILGMGDMLTLIEKAQQAFDEKKAEELEKKMRDSTFTLVDFLDQMEQMKKMGPLDQLLGMIPGMNTAQLKDVQIDEKKMLHTEAIIKSMTKGERENRDKLIPKRRERIAKGSGTTVAEVNALVKQFEQMQKMMKMMSGGKLEKQMKRMGKMGKMGKMKFPF